MSLVRGAAKSPESREEQAGGVQEESILGEGSQLGLQQSVTHTDLSKTHADKY